MKPIGYAIRKIIEDRKIVKRRVAEGAGISYNALSMIFNKDTIDCELLDKICQQLNVYPGFFFEDGGYDDIPQYGDTHKVSPELSEQYYKDKLLAEKERMIQHLMSLINGTKSEQD